MGLYDKIANSLVPVQRKLFDHFVMERGRKLTLNRIYSVSDIWGNVEPSSHESVDVEAVVIFPPGEIPLLRFRSEESGAQAHDTGLFFYDILPIEVFFKFSDKVEIGDVFHFSILDEYGNKAPVILKVVDLEGSLTTEVIWKKHICAPITSLSEVTPELAAIIQAEVADE